MEDLFEKYEELPEEVQAIIGEFDNGGNDYRVLEAALEKLEPLGYTFDYYLDGIPCNLQKIDLEVKD